MSNTLFDLVGEFHQLYEIMADPDMDPQIIEDTLEGLKGELEVKASGYIAVIKQLEMEQKGAEAEAEFFKTRADVRKNNIKRMKEALCTAMIETGHDDKNGLKAGNYTLKVAGNGGKQPLKITGDVPEGMTKIIIEPDTERIRAYLEGIEGNSCEWANLEPRGKHLNIK